jgi:Tfp pilus assembly protein PilO
MKDVIDRLGMPGVLGLGLLLFCLAFYFGNLLPLQRQLAEAETEQAQLVAAARRDGPGSARAAAGQALPPFREAPELLKQLNALAVKHGVVVERSTYLLKDKEGPLRLEVGMPLTLGYPALRAYLRDVLALAAVSLDELSLQRALASDTVLDVQLRLSFGFARTP